MNATGTGLMDAIQLAGLVADVGALITDPTVGTSITWYGRRDRGYTPGSGEATYLETPTVLTGFLGDIDLAKAPPEQGAQLGDVRLLVRYADLATLPATGQRFTAGSKHYAVYAAILGPLSTHYVLDAHRVD